MGQTPPPVRLANMLLLLLLLCYIRVRKERKEKIRPGAWIEEASWILSPGGISQLPVTPVYIKRNDNGPRCGTLPGKGKIKAT